MKLSETAIRRPVLASMLSAALVLFGVIGYTRLSVRELPDIDPPIISVTTVLPGANAQVVETAVTDVLEEELSTIQGLRTLSSTSSEQTSNIGLEFTLDRPVDMAAKDGRDKVSRVRGRLPVDVLEPVIAKQSADAQPFFWLAISRENYDPMQLSYLAARLWSSANDATRCASGYSPRRCRRAASRSRTSRARSSRATSKSRRAGSS